jgi:Tfp pilus assembly PilM family ATPase
MAKQPSVVVGIDLGSRFIKVAEVRAGRPPVVTNIGIAPTPEGAVDSTGVVDKAAVAATLKKLLAETGIGTKQAAFALAGQNSVVVRILEVPQHERRRTQAAHGLGDWAQHPVRRHARAVGV